MTNIPEGYECTREWLDKFRKEPRKVIWALIRWMEVAELYAPEALVSWGGSPASAGLP